MRVVVPVVASMGIGASILLLVGGFIVWAMAERSGARLHRKTQEEEQRARAAAEAAREAEAAAQRAAEARKQADEAALSTAEALRRVDAERTTLALQLARAEVERLRAQLATNRRDGGDVHVSGTDQAQPKSGDLPLDPL